MISKITISLDPEETYKTKKMQSSANILKMNNSKIIQSTVSLLVDKDYFKKTENSKLSCLKIQDV